jgi:peptide/nickel transport system ATP-binding protein
VDDVAVMYAGRIVEHARTATIFNEPEHPYTWGLLGSIARIDASRDVALVPIPGRPPSLITLPSGCSFHPRCPYVKPRHTEIDPALEAVPGSRDHSVACLLAHSTRQRIWAELREGRRPEEVRETVKLEDRQA